MKIKVMEYNILYGFHSYQRKFERERLKAAKRVVKKENPDVLILMEACFGDLHPKDPNWIKLDYLNLFGYDYGLYFAMEKNEWGLMVLSRFPIKKIRQFEMGPRKTLRCKLRIGKAKEIYLDVVHPPPQPIMSEKEKVKYFDKILEQIQTPYLLVGDFNSISPKDKYNRKTMLPAFKKFAGKEFAPIMLKDLFSFKLVRHIESKGLIDSVKNVKKFYPTIPSDYLSKDKRSAMRIDYIFHSKDFETLKFYNIDNKDTNMASDHLPIVAVLKLK